MGRPPVRDASAPRRLRVPSDSRGRRMLVVVVVLGLVFLATAAQLVRVQIVQGERYAALGAEQRDRTIDLLARRGRIYDREGAVLATSVDAATIYADPRAFRAGRTPDGTRRPPAEDPERAARLLAPVLDRDPGAIREELTSEGHFVYLARQQPWRVGEEVRALELDGVGVLTESTREYPAGDLASHVLGFTGIDGEGLEGLELAYDEVLRGRDGQLRVERAPGGLSIASGMRELVPARPGTDLVLTLDREIQSVAEDVARRVVGQHRALGAGIVVLEVDTGDVLAMANAPGYHPGRVERSEPAARRNRAVTDLYEPGSVQKAITAAAALEAGVVTPRTVLEVPDRYPVGGKTFTDSHPHETERMSFAEIIETSSNVGTIKVAERLGAQRLARALEEFGYGEPVGVDFPGEAGGLMLPVEQWWSTSLPTIAIGQGVAVTLLQAAHAYATIANDGVAVTPRLVRGTVGEDGRLDPAAAGDQRRILAGDTARQVQRMLHQVVVGQRGTGSRATVPGYTVAGKTGTARKPSTEGRGYSGDFVATFVGFGPVEDPRLVVAVMVDSPQPIWGGVVAAPAFSEVMEFALPHRGVPPDRASVTLEDALADARAARAEAARRDGPRDEGGERPRDAGT